MQGLHISLAVGAALCAFQFAHEYAKIQLSAVHIVPPLAAAKLPHQVRSALSLFEGNLAALSITGAKHAFMTSAVLARLASL